jgi:hypothetical protein
MYGLRVGVPPKTDSWACACSLSGDILAPREMDPAGAIHARGPLPTASGEVSHAGDITPARAAAEAGMLKGFTTLDTSSHHLKLALQEHVSSLRTGGHDGNSFSTCGFISRSRGNRNSQREVSGARAPAVRHPPTATRHPHRKAQDFVLISPSCTTETTSSPSWVKTWPRASPRAPDATGDSCA